MNQKGFTLVETLFMVAIFPVIMLAVYSVLNSANVIMNTNDIYSRINLSAMQSLRYVNREIGQTSPNTLPSHLVIGTSNGSSTVRFQVPVDWDGDGDVVSGTLNPAIEWGAYTNVKDDTTQAGDALLGGWIRYSVSNNRLVREVLDAMLVPIGGTSTTVANNVETFTVAQSGNNLDMTLVLRVVDTLASKGAGGNQRIYRTTVTNRTLLRNAVN